MVRVFGHVVVSSVESLYQKLKYTQQDYDVRKRIHQLILTQAKLLYQTVFVHIVICVCVRIHDLFAVEKIKIIQKR